MSSQTAVCEVCGEEKSLDEINYIEGANGDIVYCDDCREDRDSYPERVFYDL